MYFVRQQATRAFKILEKVASTAGEKQRIREVLDKVLGDTNASETAKKDAAKELVGAYNDYTLVRDRLCAAYARNIKTDSYGKLDDRKVDLAFQKIAKQEGLERHWYIGFSYGAAKYLICFAAEDLKKREKQLSSSYDRGIEYERKVVEKLKSIAPSAALTPPGADFGVDLTFHYRKKLFAGQCKALAKPAGVSAIREIVTGAQHFDADHAVVFSLNSFTDNALELATTNKVICIEGLDFSSIDRQIAAFQ
ncbi:restriction endonuclease [Hyphomonas atlantica corrig.]|uniref:restriction endonuclease n=1 Tax=Hyphomonas atlantica TaxID=1280948 RepID=UPI002357B45B|nr:restriction endonuclease [Hyphomonas atlantica]